MHRERKMRKIEGARGRSMQCGEAQREREREKERERERERPYSLQSYKYGVADC